MIYTLIIKLTTQLTNVSGEKIGVSSGVQKREEAWRKKRKATAALGQTEDEIDEEPQCNLYSDSDNDAVIIIKMTQKSLQKLQHCHQTRTMIK